MFFLLYKKYVIIIYVYLKYILNKERIGENLYQVKVYYTFCSLNVMEPKVYLKYQRTLADKLLNYGFTNQFRVEFKRDNIGKGIYGKPYWKREKNFQFNVSNTNGLVVCALSNMEIGVDAEKIRNVRMPVISRCCTEAEIAYITKGDMGSTEESLLQRFFQIWTLKESYIKMTGEGMHFPMKEVAFIISSKTEQNDDVTEKKHNKKIICNQPAFFLQKKIKDYWISLCTSYEVDVSWKEIKIEEL